jgi:1-acyl-sn-glycerol-3-phosphate acyltransferase
MGILYDFWPRDEPTLHNQTTLADISDEEFNATFAPRPVTKVQIWLQRLSFVIFFGWLRFLCFFPFAFVFVLLVYPIAVAVPIIPWIRPLGIAIGKLYARGLLWCYGIWWIRRIGKFHPKTRQITYNHTTVTDGILMYLVQTSTFVMAAGTKNIPAFGKMFQALGSVFIDRSRQAGSSMLLSEAIKDHSLFPVAVAPEAKLSNGDVVFRFRTGGFLTSEQIQPLAFRFYRLLPFVGGELSWFVPSFWDYFKTVICSPGFVAEVTWLDPIASEKLEEASPQERADATQLALANYLGTLVISKSTKEFFQKTTEEKAKTE